MASKPASNGMNSSTWEQVIVELERASARLTAALPDNTPLIEDALRRRAEAIGRMQGIAAPPDAETLARLEKVAKEGAAAQQQLILSREQLRDHIARLNQSAYLGRVFSKSSGTSPKAFDCEG
jgi:hypothetical protein